LIRAGRNAIDGVARAAAGINRDIELFLGKVAFGFGEQKERGGTFEAPVELN